MPPELEKEGTSVDPCGGERSVDGIGTSVEATGTGLALEIGKDGAAPVDICG